MFYNPVGLQGWEVAMASGLFAVGFLAIATGFAFTLAWFVDRERAPATHPVAAPKPVPQPTAAPVPEFAAAPA